MIFSIPLKRFSNVSIVNVLSPSSSSWISFSYSPMIECHRHASSGNTISSKNLNPNYKTKSRKRTLWRWGSHTCGQSSWKTLFRKTSDSIVIEKTQFPKVVEGFIDVNIQNLVAGYDHAAFTVDGQLYTFGSNDSGQLGRKTVDQLERSTPQVVPLPCNRPVISVSCGLKHTAAVTDEGTLYTWGWGGSFWSSSGALGSGTKESWEEPRPVQQFVSLGEKVLQVACGSQHTVVLTESGRLFSTGKGEMGRLGLGSNQDKSRFEEIDTFCSLPSNIEFSKIACGSCHCITLLRSGEIFVWGRNDNGQLGLDDGVGDIFSHESFPRQLLASTLNTLKVTDIACGENATAVLSGDGQIFFFGARLWLVPTLVRIPREVTNELKGDIVTKVVLGGLDYSFAYAMTRLGRLLSWGRSKSQCLARNATNQNAGQPYLLDSSLFKNQKVVDVACGRNRVLAVTCH